MAENQECALQRLSVLKRCSAHYTALPGNFPGKDAASRQESVREVLRDYYRRYRAELAALSEQAAANGEAIRIRAPELATALVALFEGLTLLWMVEPEGVNLRQVTERALDGLLVNSICG